MSEQSEQEDSQGETGETGNAALVKFDIGIDLDGVGFDMERCLRAYGLGVGIPGNGYPPVDTWDFTGWGWSRRTVKGALAGIVECGWLGSAEFAYPDFAPGMRELAARGHRLHIITDRARIGDAYGGLTESGLAVKLTQEWLHEIEAPYESLLFTASKGLIGAELDYAIDDAPHHIEAYGESDVDCFVRDQLYNRYPEGDDDYWRDYWRVSSFSEFLERIKRRDQG